MAGSKSVWSLIVIPALITLAVTLLRLVGDLEHWPSPWFSNAAGGGGASVVLSIVGIHNQGGGRRSLGDSPRMPAAFFGRRPDAPEAIASDYPEEVWAYLNSATPAQPEMGTRRELLIAKWRSEGRIEQDGSPKGERRIESLSSNISHVRRLSIDELSDRVAMLLDVRATLSLMKRDLRAILLGLSAGHGNR